jgi:hypothetical protein
MTVFASAGNARTFNYQAGDVGYVPFAMAHYVQNLGNEPLGYLEMFRSPRFTDVSLNQWMALTPRAGASPFESGPPDDERLAHAQRRRFKRRDRCIPILSDQRLLPGVSSYHHRARNALAS